MNSPLPGQLIFAFSYEDCKDGSRFYHILYNEQLDEHNNAYQVIGGIYRLIKDYPQLIEPLLHVTHQAAEELSQPFDEILKQK